MNSVTKPHSTPRLLLIDDEDAVLKLVKSMLTRANYDVTTCQSAEEAILLLSEEAFDCVVTDAVMPKMSGYDLVKTVRHDPNLSDLPVLMLTRKRHRQDIKEAVEAGVTDYVLKPVDEQLLLEKVEMWVKKGGKQAIHEHTLTIVQSEAELRLSCRVSGVSETDIILRISIEIEEQIPFQIHSRIFEEIGIGTPILKLLSCTRVDAETPMALTFPYEARFGFVAVAEADQAKIRSWLELQSRKRHK